MPSFIRPTLPYDNESLPNDNRYTELAARGESPPAEAFEADFNYLIYGLNDLQAQLLGLAAGAIPGSSIAANVNKLVTTNGAGVLSFIFVGTDNLEAGAITTLNIANGAVTYEKIGPGAVRANSILADAVTTAKILNLAITTAKIALKAITAAQIDDKTITADQIADTTITALQIALKTITEAQVADATLTGAKMVPKTVTNRELADVCRWNPGDIKESVAQAASPGFLNCNGEAVLRATYADLFLAIGTTFGVGDGATTFNLPDRRGRVPVGFDYTQAGSNAATGTNVTNTGNDPAGHAPYTIAYQGGEQAHALTADENGAHTHTYGSNVLINLAGGGGDVYAGAPANQPTGSSGLGTPHNNLQPYCYSIYWIYAGV